MSKKWHIRDVVLVVLMAFLFGGVFMVTGYLYSGLTLILTPMGLEPFGNNLLFGLWTIAGPMAAMLIRKPGSSTLGEVLAALAEMLYGSYFGATVLLSGLIQGLGSELGFMASGYRVYNAKSLTLAAVGTTVLSFGYEYVKMGYSHYSLGFVGALLVTRLLSVIVTNVGLVLLLAKAVTTLQFGQVGHDERA